MATEVSSVFPEARVGRADGVSLWGQPLGHVPFGPEGCRRASTP